MNTPAKFLSTVLLLSFFTICLIHAQNFGVNGGEKEREARKLYEEGIAKAKDKKYHEAIRKFNEAIDVKPDFYPAYSYRGSVRCEIGNYEEAMDDFDAALRINPDYPYALNNRGYVLLRFGGFDKAAVADFDRAIELKPDFGQAYYNRGIVKEIMRDKSGACADWKMARSLGIKIPDTYTLDCNDLTSNEK